MQQSAIYPRVTVGVPVYNGAASIGKILDNLLSQTLLNFELVISDNCSTDNTEAICRFYANKDSRISYHRQTRNIGPTANFSFLVDVAKCEYFLLAACDDLRSLDFLELNVAFLDTNPDYVASTCPNWFEGQTVAEAVRFAIRGRPEERFGSFFQHCWQSHGVFYSLVRTEVLRECEVLGGAFTAIDWAIDLFLVSHGKINRTGEGYTIFGRGGISQQVGAYKATRSNLLELLLPFLRFGAYAWKLSRPLTPSARLCLLIALARLNLQAVMDQSFSALYQWYVRNLRPLIFKLFS